jgi:hypothetical protein
MRGYEENRERHPAGALPIRDLAEGRTPRTRDWVFSVEDSDSLDLQGISLLMTARELAQDEGRTVWLAGLPMEFWRFMNAMGLEGYFIPFPDREPSLA